MAKKTFEQALARLEEITRELEEGDLSLEQSLKKFDEGIKLTRFCNEKLEDVRARVELLLAEDDSLSVVDFHGENNGD